MRALENSERRVMVILADNTALCFSPTESRTWSRAPRAPWPKVPTRRSRIGKFLKSLLPKVTKVSPVEAVLQSGQRLKLIAPPGVC